MTIPDNEHPVDEFLRRAAGTPTPTAANRRHAERSLNHAIEREDSLRRSRQTHRRWTVPVLAGALVVILAVAVALQVTRPSPASAALLQIARAAELANPINIPDQSYAYTRSHSTVRGIVPPDGIPGRTEPLIYLLPQTRNIWVARSGTVQISTTFGTPEFFTVQDRIDYYNAGLDEIDQVNETVTLAATGLTSILDERSWPTTPEDLKAAILEDFPTERQASDAAITGVALSLITETGASPELKAAVLRVISSLDMITLIERHHDGSATFNLNHTQPQPTSLEFTIDANGNLLSVIVLDIQGDPEQGIPPNTVLERTTYEPTIIVNSLDPR